MSTDKSVRHHTPTSISMLQTSDREGKCSIYGDYVKFIAGVCCWDGAVRRMKAAVAGRRPPAAMVNARSGGVTYTYDS